MGSVIILGQVGCIQRAAGFVHERRLCLCQRWPEGRRERPPDIRCWSKPIGDMWFNKAPHFCPFFMGTHPTHFSHPLPRKDVKPWRTFRAVFMQHPSCSDLEPMTSLNPSTSVHVNPEGGADTDFQPVFEPNQPVLSFLIWSDSAHFAQVRILITKPHQFPSNYFMQSIDQTTQINRK